MVLPIMALNQVLAPQPQAQVGSSTTGNTSTSDQGTQGTVARSFYNQESGTSSLASIYETEALDKLQEMFPSITGPELRFCLPTAQVN